MGLTKIPYSMINGAPVNPIDFGADVTGVANSTTAFLVATLTKAIQELKAEVDALKGN